MKLNVLMFIIGDFNCFEFLVTPCNPSSALKHFKLKAEKKFPNSLFCNMEFAQQTVTIAMNTRELLFEWTHM